MDIVGAIASGFLFVLVGVLFRALLDIDVLRPSVDRSVRSAALFRQFYIAPELITLAFGLLVSCQGIEELLENRSIPTRLDDRFAFWFWSLVAAFIIAMLVCVLFWLLPGDTKYIPIGRNVIQRLNATGELKQVEVHRPYWIEGIFCQAGLLNLILGNSIGAACVFAFWWFAASAF